MEEQGLASYAATKGQNTIQYYYAGSKQPKKKVDVASGTKGKLVQLAVRG